MLDGETECVLMLLDLCSAMLEDFSELKATIQDLQVALRKGDDAAVSIKIQSCTHLVKKGKKYFKKTPKKVTSDKEDYGMVKQLSEARDRKSTRLNSSHPV